MHYVSLAVPRDSRTLGHAGPYSTVLSCAGSCLAILGYAGYAGPYWVVLHNWAKKQANLLGQVRYLALFWIVRN